MVELTMPQGFQKYITSLVSDEQIKSY